MSRKPKLTETTNDMLGAGPAAGMQPFNNGGAVFPTVHMAVHEPAPPNPVLPSIPLPPKRGRKPKEQKVNALPLAPVAEPKPLKIAMIGTAPSSRMLAPYNDPSWQIWACSPGNMEQTLPRFDVWYEVHGTNLLWPENASFADRYINWMRSLKVPLYMQDQQLCPNAITIPKDQLIEEFGPYFFTSTFSWMMAMGILAGAQEIALFGIDMASKDEYILQRPGAYHFFQEGARRGCKIWAPYESDIMQPPPLYGYSDVQPFLRKMLARRTELKARTDQMIAQRDSLSTNILYLQGALEDNDYNISIQGGAQDNASIKYLDTLLQKALSDKTSMTPLPTLTSQG